MPMCIIPHFETVKILTLNCRFCGFLFGFKGVFIRFLGWERVDLRAQFEL